ncbi:hypothetical protein SAMN02910317_01390 [Ruminococcaceae bacterium FB2012]|nr:hypothetical protein SAMN02910317_01390 [Ruminococcaceae bacterium FB2012]
MKRAIAILILAALLSGCAQTAEPITEPEQTSATTSTSAIIAERKTTASVTSKATNRAVNTTTSATEPTATTTTTARTTTTTAPVSTTTVAVSATEATSRTTTRATTTEPVSARQEPVKATTTTRSTTQSERPTTRAATTTKAMTTAMPRTTTTTAKPAVTTTTKITVSKPLIVSKATTTAIINGITYVEVPDITCLATMIENLEETDTTPYYYIQIGRSLKHDGTDYGKAVAVYDWMIENGWGSCVYHALEIYYVCQGIGLECAYAFMTDYGWYGHTFYVVKVDGKWYALDTQAGIFLDNWPYICKRMFDGNDRDLPPFDEDAFYPYDEDGEYRDWKIEEVE